MTKSTESSICLATNTSNAIITTSNVDQAIYDIESRGGKIGVILTEGKIVAYIPDGSLTSLQEKYNISPFSYKHKHIYYYNNVA